MAGPSRRGRIVIVAVLAAVGGGLAVHSLAGAALPGPATTQVDFISLPAPKAVVTNGYHGAGLTKQYVVIGGGTTVPTNATTVRLKVIVKNAQGGTLSIYPTGNPASPTNVAWAPNTTVTQEIGVNIGLANKIDVKNHSTGAATVTVQITGYSTQVTAASINGPEAPAGRHWSTTAPAGFSGASPGVRTRPIRLRASPSGSAVRS